MYTITLAAVYEARPIWWLNFIYHLDDLAYPGVYRDIIDEHLMKENAMQGKGNDKCNLYFRSAEDATSFILRWS